VLSPIVGIGTPPTPHPQARAPPPPLVPGGGACERVGGRVPIPTRGHKADSLKMNTALEYSRRVVQEGGRRCKKSTLNDLVHLTPLRIPLIYVYFVHKPLTDT
jgi:hypothetical protein